MIRTHGELFDPQIDPDSLVSRDGGIRFVFHPDGDSPVSPIILDAEIRIRYPFGWDTSLFGKTDPVLFLPVLFSGIRKSFQLYMRMRKPDLYRILIKLWHGMFPALKAGISCEAFQKSLVCMTGVFDRLFCYIIRHPKETFRYFYHSPAAFLIPSCRRILLYWRTGIILSFVCYWGATSHCI